MDNHGRVLPIVPASNTHKAHDALDTSPTATIIAYEPQGAIKTMESFYKRDEILARQGGVCFYCGKMIHNKMFVLDHLMPRCLWRS